MSQPRVGFIFMNSLSCFQLHEGPTSRSSCPLHLPATACEGMCVYVSAIIQRMTCIAFLQDNSSSIRVGWVCHFQCKSVNFWGPLGHLLATTPCKTCMNHNQKKNLVQQNGKVHYIKVSFCLSSTPDTSLLFWQSSQPTFVLSILSHLHPLPHFPKPEITIYSNTLLTFPSLSTVLKPEFNLKTPHRSNLLCQSYSLLLSPCSDTLTLSLTHTGKYTLAHTHTGAFVQ